MEGISLSKELPKPRSTMGGATGESCATMGFEHRHQKGV